MSHRFHYSCLLTLCAAISGCVVVPMNRTYYDPNPADGTPIQSASCGWNATAKDALKREIAGVGLSVFPTYAPGTPFKLFVLLQRSGQSVEVLAETAELKVGSEPLSHRATSVKVREAGPYFYKSIEYQFPVVDSAQEIAVLFPTGFLKIDGRTPEILPFRFSRVTRSDVYYGSINC